MNIDASVTGNLPVPCATQCRKVSIHAHGSRSRQCARVAADRHGLFVCCVESAIGAAAAIQCSESDPSLYLANSLLHIFLSSIF